MPWVSNSRKLQLLGAVASCKQPNQIIKVRVLNFIQFTAIDVAVIGGNNEKLEIDGRKLEVLISSWPPALDYDIPVTVEQCHFTLEEWHEQRWKEAVKHSLQTWLTFLMTTALFLLFVLFMPTDTDLNYDGFREALVESVDTLGGE